MNQWAAVKIASVGDVAVTLADLVATMKVADAMQDVVNSLAIRHAAKTWGIEVGDAELQAEADTVRRSLGLEKADATNQWLSGRHLSVDDWERTLEANVLRRKVRERVVRDQGRSYFGAHQAELDSALIHRIVVTDKTLADDLHGRLTSGRIEFAKAARQYSVDRESRYGGGFLGYVQRGDLPAETAAAVFSAKKGDIVGPLATNAGHELFWVEDLVPAAYTNAGCRSAAEEQCFREWLRAEGAKARIEI
jgi:foldase protein PrsA